MSVLFASIWDRSSLLCCSCRPVGLLRLRPCARSKSCLIFGTPYWLSETVCESAVNCSKMQCQEPIHKLQSLHAYMYIILLVSVYTPLQARVLKHWMHMHMFVLIINAVKCCDAKTDIRTQHNYTARCLCARQSKRPYLYICFFTTWKRRLCNSIAHDTWLHNCECWTLQSGLLNIERRLCYAHHEEHPPQQRRSYWSYHVHGRGSRIGLSVASCFCNMISAI